MDQDEGSIALYESFAGPTANWSTSPPSGALLSPCGAQLGLGESDASHRRVTHNAVSNDGSKIFFTAPDPESQTRAGQAAGCWNPETTPQENPPQLYMRLDGREHRRAVRSRPRCDDPSGLQPAVYVGASADGSKVFFVSRAELTADDTTHAPELYEYDTEAPEGERLKRISSGESGDAEGDVDFVGAISSDGSTVYFTAFGKLAAGASTIAEQQFGLVNLYRYDTVTGKTTYMAQVGADEYPLAPGQAGTWYRDQFPSAHSEAVALASNADWYTTADGRYLVFGSILPLTGYDNSGQCQNLFQGSAFGNTDGKCAEVFGTTLPKTASPASHAPAGRRSTTRASIAAPSKCPTARRRGRSPKTAATCSSKRSTRLCPTRRRKHCTSTSGTTGRSR